MTFQEMLNEEREEGRKEGRDTLLKSLVEQGLLSEEKALQLAEELSKRDNKR